MIGSEGGGFFRPPELLDGSDGLADWPLVCGSDSLIFNLFYAVDFSQFSELGFLRFPVVKLTFCIPEFTTKNITFPQVKSMTFRTFGQKDMYFDCVFALIFNGAVHMAQS